MKNYLEKFEQNRNQEFFIMKSYVFATFEIDRKKSEYHIFYIKPNSNPEAYQEGYKDLKVRRMNKKEIKYLKSHLDKYKMVLSNEDGSVYNLIGRPFDKTRCQKYKQFMLNL
jgi:hypothetical protein